MLVTPLVKTPMTSIRPAVCASTHPTAETSPGYAPESPICPSGCAIAHPEQQKPDRFVPQSRLTAPWVRNDAHSAADSDPTGPERHPSAQAFARPRTRTPDSRRNQAPSAPHSPHRAHHRAPERQIHHLSHASMPPTRSSCARWRTRAPDTILHFPRVPMSPIQRHPITQSAPTTQKAGC